jgi:hypothetical protein
MSLDRYLQRVKVNGARKGLFTLSVTLAFTLATGQVSEREEVAYGTTTNLAARKTPCWAGGDATFAQGPVPKVTRGSLQPNKKLPSVRACAARIWVKQVKKAGITYFIFVFTIFFSLGCA